MSDNSNHNDIRNVKQVLIKFIRTTSKILKRLSETNEIPSDDTIFPSQKEKNDLAQSIKDAYKDLQIDPNPQNDNHERLDKIINDINEIKDENRLKEVGFFGKILKFKISVFDKIRKKFFDLLKNLTQNLNKILRVFKKLVNVIDAILNSLAKLIPGVDAIAEFKDVYANTRKSIEDILDGKT